MRLDQRRVCETTPLRVCVLTNSRTCRTSLTHEGRCGEATALPPAFVMTLPTSEVTVRNTVVYIQRTVCSV